MFTKSLRGHNCLRLFTAIRNSNATCTPISSFKSTSFTQKLTDDSKSSNINNGKTTFPPKVAENEADFLVKLKYDPDNFGSRKNIILDQGDLKEDEFLKYRPPNSKKLSTKQYADLIKKFLSSGKIKEAIDVLEIKMIKEDQVKPENYIYNLLLGACGRRGFLKKAFSLYNEMKKRGLKATGGTYTALFNACANSPNASEGLEKAQHLRNIMVEKLYEPNDTNYHVMIKTFGRCGCISTAFSIVDEMLTKKIRISSDTMNFLLQACIEDKESGFRHALLVWRKMIKLNIRPSIFTYNLMLHAIRDCNLGSLEITENVIKQILEEKNKIQEDPNKLTLITKEQKLLFSAENNALIPEENKIQLSNYNYPNLMAKIPELGNLISLREIVKPEDKLLLVGGMDAFLNDMKENEVTPDIKTYSLLLDNIPCTLAAEQKLLTIMKKSGVKIDVDFFNMLMKKRIMRNDYDEAKSVLRLMEKYSLRPNIFTYGMMALCCKNESEASKFLDEMKNSKYRLNAEILGSLLRKACYLRNFTFIHKIMEICVEENVQPNKRFIEHLEEFRRNCRRMIKNNIDKVGQSKSFQKEFQLFRLQYKEWIGKVKMDDAEHVNPSQELENETDPRADKYFLDKSKSVRFKPRRRKNSKVDEFLCKND